MFKNQVLLISRSNDYLLLSDDGEKVSLDGPFFMVVFTLFVNED